MTGWSGEGLPPVAQARVERAHRDRVRTSFFSAPEAVTLAHAGFEPVGDVMGCVVQHIGWAGYGCGAFGPAFGLGTFAPPTITSAGAGVGGYGPYVQALYYGYDTALHRMLLEARALGADGVVGVRWTQQRLDDVGNREFVALGTAVRARTGPRPAHLFSTDLVGQDFVKLLHAGWVTSGLVIGVAVGVRHDDYYTRAQASAWSATNLEVTGYTELVTFVRADARHQFAARAAGQGGEAAVVSGMDLHVWAVEPSENHRDHVAESLVVGTAVARFHHGPRPPVTSLMMMPLRTPSRRTQS